jgi:hypothetical protein
MRRIPFLTQAAGLLLLAAAFTMGCEQNDLGRYCVLGMPVPPVNFNHYCGHQPTLTGLNVEAPECQGRICLQQGPVKLHEVHVFDPTAQCEESWCTPPYRCDPAIDNKCAYRIKAVCTRECTKHSDCKRGPDDANGKVCTKYICHKQPRGEAFEDHCLCVCKDFLINPEADPPIFFQPEDTVDEPQGCR